MAPVDDVGPSVGTDTGYIKALAPVIMVVFLLGSIAANHRNILAGFCCRNHKGSFFATNR